MRGWHKIGQSKSAQSQGTAGSPLGSRPNWDCVPLTRWNWSNRPVSWQPLGQRGDLLVRARLPQAAQ